MSKRSEKITGFGKQCRKLRIDKGLSMAEVAEMTGKRQNYVSQVESGKFNPSIDFLNKSAEIYGLTGAEKVKFFAEALSTSRRIELKLDEVTIIPKADLAKLLAILAFNLENPYPDEKEWKAVKHCMDILKKEIAVRSLPYKVVIQNGPLG
jgi:transcriptional regulator with XRE-family HTH domain